MAIKYAVLIGSILSRNVDASKVLSQSDEPALSVPHFNLNEVMSDEEFANTEFIVLSQQQQLNTGADSRSKVNEVEILAQGATGSSSSLAATDSGVVCETVCRPRQSSAGGVPQEAQTAFIETGHQEDAERVTQPIESQSLKELELRFASQLDDMARSFNRTLCSATGGSWVESTSTCAPFMQASNVAVSACDGSGIFDACSNGVDTTADLDVEYIPCSPFQALSLAHLQKDWVPDQVSHHELSSAQCVCPIHCGGRVHSVLLMS